jgi:hypothetical protein
MKVQLCRKASGKAEEAYMCRHVLELYRYWLGELGEGHPFAAICGI